MVGQSADTISSPAPKQQPRDTLPQGWEAHTSRSTGEVYYYNTITEETTYDRPTEPVAEARPIKRPGAAWRQPGLGPCEVSLVLFT